MGAITNYIPTFVHTAEYVQGTVRELVKAGITANGVTLDKAALSVLVALGFADVVATAKKTPSASGIAPTVYRIKFEQLGQFSIVPIDLQINSAA